MAEDTAVSADKEPATVSTEALRKAESYIEAEEGATNRLAGWAGLLTTGIAVIMSAFPLYPAYHIVPTPGPRLRHRADAGATLHPRRVRARAELPAVPGRGALPQRHPLVGRHPGGRERRDHRLRTHRRRRLHRPRDGAGALGRHRRLHLHRAAARGDAAHHRPDHAGRRG